VPKQVRAKKEVKKEGEPKVARSFVIDCAKPVEDKVFNTTNFSEFLKQRIKINGKTGKLGESVRVANDDKKVTVKADVAFSKRYLKYLTKKYLKRHSLREFLYVIAVNKQTYQIKYFNIQQEGADQE
jgi:large subunit ribosomal protein L22e